ncbi:hypothetical protein CEXT_634221 [Caerostris extrusa]|uniref:Uncharacterized protein n=1 Tax=Caerostris extrusa TaxID=172846 RepID=A0AAV4RFP2_CAEEX|nr:hypothetical protein CEXT_634221 [Caerostris extrusa]
MRPLYNKCVGSDTSRAGCGRSVRRTHSLESPGVICSSVGQLRCSHRFIYLPLYLVFITLHLPKPEPVWLSRQNEELISVKMILTHSVKKTRDFSSNADDAAGLSLICAAIVPSEFDVTRTPKFWGSRSSWDCLRFAFARPCFHHYQPKSR